MQVTATSGPLSGALLAVAVTGLLTLPLTAQEESNLTGPGRTEVLDLAAAYLSGDLRCVVTAPNGRYLASADAGGMVYLWDAATGKDVRRFSGEPCSITALAFSPSGKVLAAAGGQQQDALGLWVDGTLCAWEVATGKEIRRDRASGRAIRAIRFTPDGKALVCACPGGTLQWEFATGSQTWKPLATDKIVAAGSAGAAPDRGSFFGQETGLAARLCSRTCDPGDKQLDDLWGRLAASDATAAYEAVGILTAAPGRAEPFLAARLRPVPLDVDRRLTLLIAALDDRRWAVRDQADAEIETYGELAEPALRRALQRPASPEVSRRAERLLERLEIVRPAPETLRAQRAVEVLEELGTSDAQKLLQGLAHGAPTAAVTQDARAALERLARRP
jgi:hypothetical protein